MGDRKGRTKMTQNEKIKRHLIEVGTITPLEALGEYGIMRLASRISDIKKEGFRITRTLKTAQNRYGETTRFAEYKLVGLPERKRTGA